MKFTQRQAGDLSAKREAKIACAQAKLLLSLLISLTKYLKVALKLSNLTNRLFISNINVLQQTSYLFQLHSYFLPCRQAGLLL
jgi:hypothetical protein